MRDAISLCSSGFLYQGLYLTRSLIAARVLGPQLMGIWAAGYIFNMYLNCSHLGSLSAVRREMTIARGAGDEARVEALMRAGLTMALIPGLLVALGLGAWVGLRWHHVAPTYRWLVPLVSALSVLQQMGIFYSFCLYSQEKFGAASVSQAVTSALLVATMPMIWWWGLPGFALGFLVSQLVGVTIVARAAAVPLRLCADSAVLGCIVRQGLLFLGPALLLILQSNIDRIVILRFYGEQQLGLYSVALQPLALVHILMDGAGQVAYARMASLFGQTPDPAALYKHFVAWGMWLAWGTAPILVAVYLCVPPVVEGFLPHYVEAIPAARLACVQAFCMTLAVIPASFLWTIRRTGRYFALRAMTTGLATVLCVLSVAYNMGLIGIIVANTAAAVTYTAGLRIVAARYAKQPLPRWLPALSVQNVP